MQLARNAFANTEQRGTLLGIGFTPKTTDRRCKSYALLQ
jgi:hypothetical protein